MDEVKNYIKKRDEKGLIAKVDIILEYNYNKL